LAAPWIIDVEYPARCPAIDPLYDAARALPDQDGAACFMPSITERQLRHGRVEAGDGN
jgi:hypothetical protein